MNDFSLQLHLRDFSAPVLLPGLAFDVKRFSWADIGGPDKAQISVTGDFPGMWNLLTQLRAPAEIYSPEGIACWWGYVAVIVLQYELLEIELSIDPMWNSVAVMYNELETGQTGIGTRGTTAYTTDTDSINDYGTKQHLVSMPDMNAAGAAAGRDSFLARWKYPIAVENPRGAAGKMEGATLFLRGWWDTVRWLMYSRFAGIESHEVGNATQALGAVATNEKIKMEFQLSTAEGWAASAASVRMSKESAAAELSDPTIELWTAGLGAQLATGTIDRSEIAELPRHNWVTAQWSANPDLALATTYVFLLDSHGTYVDDEYSIVVDEDLGYASGAMELFDAGGSTWAARNPNADLVFRMSGVEETTVQMEKVYDTFSQFLTAFDLAFDTDGTEQVSAIFTSQYRDGDVNCLEEMLDLLAAGRLNGNRYLAHITQNRVLQIREEADAPTTAIDYHLDSKGRLFKGAMLVPAGKIPVGFWMRTLHSVPAAVRNSLLAQIDPIFVDWIEYDVASGTVRIKSRDMENPFDLASMLRAGR